MQTPTLRVNDHCWNDQADEQGSKGNAPKRESLTVQIDDFHPQQALAETAGEEPGEQRDLCEEHQKDRKGRALTPGSQTREYNRGDEQAGHPIDSDRSEPAAKSSRLPWQFKWGWQGHLETVVGGITGIAIGMFLKFQPY